MFRGDFQTTLPETGKPYGVDLTCNALVAPYGRGKHAHLFLQLDFTEDPVRWWNRTATLTITFPNVNDAWLSTPLGQSDYDMKRGIPLRARKSILVPYQDARRLVFRRTVKRKGKLFTSGVDEPILLRLCTLPDKSISRPRQRVSPANYGCLRKTFFDFNRTVKFEYWMNPPPDDQNLNPMDGVTLVNAQTGEAEQDKEPAKTAIASL